MTNNETKNQAGTSNKITDQQSNSKSNITTNKSENKTKYVVWCVKTKNTATKIVKHNKYHISFSFVLLIIMHRGLNSLIIPNMA